MPADPDQRAVLGADHGVDRADRGADIATILDKRGIAVRAGTHCAMPLMQHYGLTATARASFAMYNTTRDADALIDGLVFCRELFG